MDCKEICKKLSAYLDDELDRDRTQAIKGHLVHCRECRDEFTDLQTVDNALKNLSRPPVPDRFSRHLLMNIRATSGTTRDLKIICRPLAALLKFFENFFELLEPPSPLRTGTLEEFADFPPCSLANTYFNLLKPIG